MILEVNHIVGVVRVVGVLRVDAGDGEQVIIKRCVFVRVSAEVGTRVRG
jgi:hypothetical protein